MNHTFGKALRAVFVATMMSLTGSNALAQVRVNGSVYGGGNQADVGGSVTINMTAGTVEKDVYGGGALANTNINNVTAGYGTSSETISSTSVNTTTVNLLGGTIVGDAYGGGLGRQANNNVSPAVTAVEAKVYGDVKLYLNGMEKSFYDAADDAMKAVFDTRITKTGSTFYLVKTDTKGAVVERVFGANNKNGSPQGNVTVHVFATQSKDASKTTVNQKFANENINLTSISEVSNLKAILADLIQKGTKVGVTITSYQEIYDNTSATVEQVKTAINGINAEIKAKTSVENPTESESAAIQTLNALIYDVKAVYGGGNQAAYNPASPYTTSNTTGAKTQVIIEGCSLTSIETVYGGGNAAAVPETNVEIKEAYEIQSVFGGGNGYSATGNHTDPSAANYNPGADVGVYKEGTTETTYGTGNANAILKGGYIHEAYGGSNQKGNIKGKININTNPEGGCDLCVDKLVGAGKNADVDGDLIMILGCKPTTKTPLIFGGADNANVNGNVELTITSGTFGKVFGGNNLGGAIKGHIVLNIEETGCTPINIDELYLGGNQAAYSIYGYYEDTQDNNKVKPRTAAMQAVANTDPSYIAPVGNPTVDAKHPFPYAQPVLNIVSATSIGKVFGGGLGAGAVMHANPTVNINMIKGTATGSLSTIGTIGDVFGGGNAAEVVGNTMVNIGTESKVNLTSVPDDAATTEVDESEKTVLGAHITGDVFGGGNQAEVTGNTQVNICAKKSGDSYIKVAEVTGVTIEGTPPPTGGFGHGVFGGGNQGNVSGDSYVYFGGGSVNQTIYGGGCVADVLGNTHVTMLDGYVFDGVCGGGLKGSVGTITEREALPSNHPTHTGCLEGKPKTFEDNTGKCTVVITGGQIGPVEVATVGMGTTAHPAPISEGWVWGAGRGAVVGPEEDPDTDFSTYVYETDVTIGGTAFIMEGVVGGGEFGRVRHNTLVKIQDQCQIGVGAGQTTSDGLKPLAYTQQQWTSAETAVRNANATAINAAADAMPACSHFPYGKEVGGKMVYDTYDPYADEYANSHNNVYLYPGGSTTNASDGKTWIGCVFAGGSGYFPYKTTGTDGKISYDWLPSAGLVEGNSEVRISGGHILTCVYGGNEVTSVKGTSKVKMTGGTIGVPRKKDELKTNPMIGNLYGAGKGDPRSQFNGLTNVGSAVVEISGGVIYGSVYGGSEDGRVDGDVSVTISNQTTTTGEGESAVPTTISPIIGTWGASYVDGNVYGGGMGATSNILAGLVKGNTNITISNGTILHNVYGGGAYGSVGTFDLSTNENKASYHVPYADMPVNWTDNTGKATISITGGTIGTTGKENGMVFGSSRGDVGAPDEIHDKLAWVYETDVTIGASNQGTTTPLIKGSVYGSGENGHTFDDAVVTVHSGTIGITDTSVDGGAAYLYRGNVYGGGCGTDMYDSDNDGTEDSYNSLAGIVYGNATVNIDGGNVVHNVYGAGAMGSVGKFEKNATTNAITFTSGGTTTIEISGGTIGVDGTAGDGNVFGAARGDKAFKDKDLALVKETGVNISGTTSTTQIKGNVYGGGEVGNVQTNTTVDIQGGAIAKNVYGGGKGVEDLFTCEQAMVGVDGEGACQDPDATVNRNKGTIVTIGNGTVGTLNGETLVQGTGNVYGGGEIGRVEWNTQVKIGVGTGNGTFAPVIYGNVFGAGKGLETHGYSALVRGNSTVTIQGNANVLKNVYGGGEKSTVGRYWVKNIPTTTCQDEDEPQAPDVPDGMPYKQRSGGICSVTIQGSAQIGPDAGASTDAGHVFGAGKGVNPSFTLGTTKRMVKTDDGGELRPFTEDATLGKTAEELYLEFLQTLALVTNSNVTIDGSAKVKGSVYGGSESGFVQHDTDVDILGGTINGDAFGGGLGLASFAEAGKVKGNTDLTVSDDGVVEGNVYGGGSLGDVGIIDKTDKKDGQLTYNYKWKKNDGTTANDIEINTRTDLNTNTGICKVTVSGGTIGLTSTPEPSKHGNVFGAGRGSSTTWWCEKAIAYAANVSVIKGTVNGNVYGGGEVGRVEDDAKVTIGDPSVSDNLTITGSVYGAGAGLATHGYSALVRGNAEVTVQGVAQIGGSVYGGGEVASVGRFHVVGGLPKNPQAGGTCTVKIQGNAKIGSSGTGHNVYGACKGVTPAYNSSNYKSVYSMQTYENRPSGNAGDTWDYYVTYDEGYTGQKFIKRYYKTEPEYLAFLKTLALTSNTHVTIGGSSSVYGSVYGGGERGITLGGVDVNMTGGTVYEDVYGGGSLADSNTAMWDATNNTLHDYAELELIPGLSVVTGYYTDKSPEKLITTEEAKATGTKYYAIYKTNVNLKGGTIKGNAYGGGLGRKEYGTEGENGYVSPIEAMVYGDVLVELNNNNEGGPADGNKTGCVVNRVFGCNNLNGTPKGKVKVHVYATQKDATGAKISDKTSGSYDVDAVYGGGNLSPYIPVDAASTNETILNAARTQVIIDGCDLTSIRQVYGGGNAASVPATFVEINGTYEIDEVFGGGNGADNYSLKEGNATVWYQNPGANVGYFDYTNTVASGTSPGTITNPDYLAVDDSDFDTKDERLADNTTAAAIRYGSGIARLEVYGGTIHTSYGGSNSRGNVRTLLSSVYSANGGCDMKVGTSYGGGKDAVSDGKVDMVADCAHGITEMFGGSMNADVDNDINLRITNGSTLGRVFGGNNTSGAINGSITVTIEEGGCEPIRIDNLYIGGYLAPYSVYGYKKKADGSYDYINKTDESGNQIQERIPLMKGDEGALAKPRQDPCLYVVSATYIGNIFGGGYQAKLVGNPHVNVNMTQGKVLLTRTGTEGAYVYKDAMGTPYTDNVTSETTGEGASAVTTYYATLPLGEIGNIYGGGNMADIIGDTYVEIGTGKCVKFVKDNEGNVTEEEETLDRNGANITGNVFGGGKGKEDTFLCEKAMIGKDGDGVNNPDGGTHVTIGNGTVNGNVYGGGEIGRVEKNTVVTVGLADAGSGKSKPVIKGSVFGGGKGEEEHGYAALVRGNPTVIIQADAKVEHNVYGGGEIASVARYNVPRTEAEVETAIAQGYDAHLGMPYALTNTTSGNCKVTVKDNAIIGPDEPMKMYHPEITDGSDEPDDAGHVFGAGKGILPKNYTYTDKNNKPKRMVLRDETIHTDDKKGTGWDYVDPNDNNNNNVWEYFADRDAYIIFIQTLALSSYANVTIGDETGSKPFVKGSVYGGSENGLVQFDTKVYIKSGQIGCGKNASEPYDDGVWADGYEPTEDLECASWDYGLDTNNDGEKDLYAPYDPNANATGDLDKYPALSGQAAKSTEGGRRIATDGHTYYGNVFGGGSGSVPYFDTTEGISKYLNSAGTVKGDTYVEIIGGHILTNVYGGCESTNVMGKATVKMTGGTLGVPRTAQQIKNHPVTCYLFGAGKGDQRIYFNKETNVNDAIVTVEGGTIYGSVFGGGEDGHVLRNTTVTIGKTDGTGPKIGTVGSTYVDGNVFGGGRGFGGEALTAGNVGGTVDLTINGGEMLGSIYGGGRLASVGYGLYLTTETGFGDNQDDGYGKMQEDGYSDWTKGENGQYTRTAIPDFKRGYITVNINGGTIGKEFENDEEGKYSGNVFGGSMGRLTKLDGSPFDDPNHWTLLATAKRATINVMGGTIKRNVYGGGEMGTLTENTYVNISGGTIGTTGKGAANYGNVYGGGKGLESQILAGIVKGITNVQISGTSSSPKIYHNVYGGGAYGSVGTFTISDDMRNYMWTNDTNPNPDSYTYNNTGVSNVTITGGMIGEDAINGNVFGGGRGVANTFWCEKGIVYKTNVNISNGTVKGNVYGGGEVGRVETDAVVTIGGANITGSVFGAGAGVETHGYSALVRGNTMVTVLDNAKVGKNVYGGGQVAAVGKYSLVDQAYLDSHPGTELEIGMPYSLVDENLGVCNVTIKGNAVIGNGGTGHVYGAGEGLVPREGYAYTVTREGDNYVFDMPRRMMSYNPSLFKADGEHKTWEYSDASKQYVWEYFDTKAKYLTFIETLGLATRTVVDIDGSAQVNGSVYGGSESGFVQHNTSVTIQGNCTIGVNGETDTDGNVFGGGLGIKGNPTAGRVSGNSMVTIKSGTMKGSVFGGGENGIVKCGVNVNVLGGTIAKDVYGGGALANTNTAMWDATNSELYDYVEVNDLIPGSSPVTGYYTAKSADALIKDQNAKAASGVKYYAIYKTTVNLLGGTINDAYGGGLGQKEVKTGETVTTPGIEAIVYGDVNLNLNGLETADYVSDIHSSLVTDVDDTNDGTYYLANNGCVVTGNVFGCNNINGTPKGHAKVHVFKTVNSMKNPSTPVDQRTTYDVEAVFGGGNAADYVPAVSDTKQSTEVIIEGCDLTSIKDVYGGGYGAATPGTNVLIRGSYIIDNVFGGGYGAGNNNPGANVGIRTAGTPYGLYLDGKTKIAVVEMMSGTVRNIYGGSNTKGDIRNGSSVTTVDKTYEPGCCKELYVEEIYGGGQEAPMEGGAEIVLGCMPEDWIGEIYAGARKADVGNDVSLTITSGKFGSVFGGNRDSGTIDGSVEVNIEECPSCGKPGIVIGELYGGGNLAPYTVPQSYVDGWKQQYGKDAYYPSPRVNVRSFTSIGTIYGGGFGASAVVTGNPTVNINVGMVQGGGLAYDPSSDNGKPSDITLYPHEKNQIGVIGNIFGGGNAAKVDGNTTVNVGTSEYEQLAGVIAGETDVTGYYTRSGSAGNYVYTLVEPVSPATSVIAKEGTLYYIKVVGADIRGNVYGGGNNAEVTGDTNVTIGSKEE